MQKVTLPQNADLLHFVYCAITANLFWIIWHNDDAGDDGGDDGDDKEMKVS